MTFQTNSCQELFSSQNNGLPKVDCHDPQLTFDPMYRFKTGFPVKAKDVKQCNCTLAIKRTEKLSWLWHECTF